MWLGLLNPLAMKSKSRMFNTLRFGVLFLSLTAIGPAALADSVTVFSTDFNSGAPPEFSGVITTEGVQGYAGLGTGPNVFDGDFLRNTSGTPPLKSTLTLTGLPPHTSISLGFLLAIIDSWDGIGCFAGTDTFSVRVDGSLVFSEVFENGCGTQSYVPPPGVELARSQFLGFNPDYLDSAYNMGLDPVFQNIPHTAGTLTVEWFAGGRDFTGGDDESWAIDNVEVILNTFYRDVILGDNPIMYWRLGETSGTIAYDETANHRDATYIHQPFLGLHGAIANDTNTSVGFNGCNFCNQYVGWIPTSSYSGAFTVEAWVKEKQINPVETFFDTRTKTADFSFDFKFDTLAGKEIHFDVGDGTQWLSNSSVPFDFKRNVWYYVAAVVTTTGATYYVDGSAIGSVTYSGTPLLFDPAHKVQIGTNTRYDSESFYGPIDEVAVYGYALTADQIAAHYAIGTGN